ncbi:MAG: hypothetical protein OXG78_15085 [Chloroflexi bacterium]|nr:hypothetical protein [Chloroflexota bacterium]
MQPRSSLQRVATVSSLAWHSARRSGLTALPNEAYLRGTWRVINGGGH